MGISAVEPSLSLTCTARLTVFTPVISASTSCPLVFVQNLISPASTETSDKMDRSSQRGFMTFKDGLLDRLCLRLALR